MLPDKKIYMDEFNVMRSAAILFILFHHLPDYSVNFFNLKFIGINYDLTYLRDLYRYFGLGIFVYISGYLLNHNYVDLSGWKNINIFFRNKIMRIIPLYLLALLIYIKLYMKLNLISFFAHVLGLQIIFSSPLIDPMVTLWYVGLIMAYYAVFCVIKYGTDIFRSILIITIIPIIALILKITINVVDKRFLEYYLVFIVGIYSVRLLKIIRNKIALTVWTSLLFIFIYFYVVYVYPVITGDNKPPLFSLISAEALVLTNLIMISFAWVMHSICMKISKCKSLFFVISFSSYCMYLFHRPFWWLMLWLYKPDGDIERGIYLGIIGIPLLILLSYLLQNTYDIIIRRLSRRNSSLCMNQ
jgi:peptidoglycan/LPS O-acetylase OafA/YrhL